MSSSRGSLNLRRAFGRRWWVLVVVVVLAVVAVVAVESRRGTTFTATASVVVNAGTSAAGPGAESEAESLAVTYAGAIPLDSLILQRVAGQVREPVSAVSTSIKVVTVSSTALLHLEFSSPTPGAAVAGARALANAVAGAHPVTPLIPGRAVTAVSLPLRATPSGRSHSELVVIGIVVGLALGVVLAIAWELLDPRVDDARGLRRVLSIPVSDRTQLDGPAATTLVRRWTQAGDPGAPVGLVAVRPEDHQRVQLLVDRLRLATGESAERPATKQRAERTSARPAGEGLRAYGAPGSDQIGQAAALAAGTVVLVATTGTRVGEIRRAGDLLEQFGHAPDWCILLPRSARRTPPVDLEPAPAVHEQEETPVATAAATNSRSAAAPGADHRPRTSAASRRRVRGTSPR